MPDFFFISYSSVDSRDAAMRLADELAAGPPAVPVWLDKRSLRPGEDWDEQVVEAIKKCKGLIFLMSPDSVHPDSVCKHEWVRALKYKKPIIPLILQTEIEAPFRLSSREYIDFTGTFDSAVARLRKHLSWMDSPEGHLQNLKHRLLDARRELPRAEADKQAHIIDDIAELERQIAQQQKVVEDPGAAQLRVRQSIEAGLQGERRPARPVSGITHGKFINPPPLIAPAWFQNRHLETQQIADFLKDESLRLLTVVGRGGVGKTAMVCRLLRSLEAGHLPDDGEAMSIDGVVYLSASREFHRPNLPDMFTGLTMLLPEDTVKRLDCLYKDPHTTTVATVEAIVRAFPRGRTVLLLDNFEDMLSVESRQIKDAELNETLRALLELPPHGLKIIITTRVAPGDLALVQPSLQRRLDLDAGLETPYAENILRAMDVDGKVGLQNAPQALLSKVRERTLGYPRALEHLFGILSADRDTSLQQLLEDTDRYLPEQVIKVLVGEAFNRLDATAQRVIQALAIYRYPVPPAAVDYLLQDHVAGIDSARVLSRLVNMQFVRRDAGRYYLHQVDRDYALKCIPKGSPDDRTDDVPALTCFALRHRAAEWFRLSRKPRDAWKTIGDLAAQLSEFELRCDGNEYDAAASVLLEVDCDFLSLWGHYLLMTQLHQRLQGKISDPGLAERSAGNLGMAYWRMGQLDKAISFYETALQMARDHQDRWGEGGYLHGLASCYVDLGQRSRAIEHLEQALAISREVGNRRGEASALGDMANRHSEVGLNLKAVEFYQQALLINQEIRDAMGEATHSHNLGVTYRDMGKPEDALRCYTRALAIAREIGYRLIEAASLGELAELQILQQNWPKAAQYFQQAIEIAEDIGSVQVANSGRRGLALVSVCRDQLTTARQVVDALAESDIPVSKHSNAAVLGIVALRQGDMATATGAFHRAVAEANELIARTSGLGDALDTKGLAHAGLALCGDGSHLSAARCAYRNARSVTSDQGIVRGVLFLFDVLAGADVNGMLGEVRREAAGVQATSLLVC